MSRRKERLTVTIDRRLLEAAREIVAAGGAESLSAWVNDALAERVAKERRLAAMARAVAAYEAEFGEITHQEIAEQMRADREAAVVVRGRSSTRRRDPRARPDDARSGQRRADRPGAERSRDVAPLATSDPKDLEVLAAFAGRHVELVTV